MTSLRIYLLGDISPEKDDSGFCNQRQSFVKKILRFFRLKKWQNDIAQRLLRKKAK